MTINIEKGRYWDQGVELVSGCTPCSPGCENCWSAANSYRFSKSNTFKTVGFPAHFTGQIETHPDRLKRFNTRKPKVFAIWNDLFHKDVSDYFIHEVYQEMHPFNIYLILTKRPERMVEITNEILQAQIDYAAQFDLCPTEEMRNSPAAKWARGRTKDLGAHIWHGLTVCNQQEADEKIPIFLQVPGKKFLSIEPMLGPIDLEKACCDYECYRCFPDNIDAIILGGETGPGARPMHPDWVRSVRDQCAVTGVPFFFKGWGKHVAINGLLFKDDGRKYFKPFHRLLDGRTHDELPWVK